MTRSQVFNPLINEISQKDNVIDGVEMLLADLKARIEAAPSLEHAKDVIRTAHELRTRISDSIVANTDGKGGALPKDRELVGRTNSGEAITNPTEPPVPVVPPSQDPSADNFVDPDLDNSLKGDGPVSSPAPDMDKPHHPAPLKKSR